MKEFFKKITKKIVEADEINARIIKAHTIKATAISFESADGKKVLALTYEGLNKLLNEAK